MTVLDRSVLALAMGLAMAGGPALAASSASSAVSDSVTTSLGSVSNSLGRSSDSSKGGEKKAAAGDYKIVEVAQMAAPGEASAAVGSARADTVRLTLQALAATDAGQPAEGALYLYLPRAVLAQAGLGAGRVVTATPRPYGIEFADAANRRAFFLVLEDAWYRELRTEVVTL